MKRLILILMLAGIVPAFGQTYTEFYVNNAGGDNLNSGHTTEATATFSAASGFFTNNTSATVCTFFKSGLNPVAGGVTNGAWASIFPDSQTLASVFIGLVTAADDTADTITVSLVAHAGTVPASDNAGATSIRVGGSWKGPGIYDGTAGVNPTNQFPFGIICGLMTNNPGVTPCINIKGGTTYSVTNAMDTTGSPTTGTRNPIRISGYTTTVRDGGKATIDGGTTYGGYVLWTIETVAYLLVTDMVFANNGTVLQKNGVVATSSGVGQFKRCIFHDFGGFGLALDTTGSVADECEIYACNKKGTTSEGGMRTSTTGTLVMNTIAHDCTGINGNGFIYTGGPFIRNIAYNNSGSGFLLLGGGPYTLMNCDSYSNALAGVTFSGTPGTLKIKNCNFVKNGGMGITNANATTATPYVGEILNCGFGSGTAANVMGDISGNIVADTTGKITYAANVTPWVDPANGNFSINLTAAKSAGRLAFLQSTVNSPTNTVAWSDIGAAQASDTNSASSEHSHTFAQ